MALSPCRSVIAPLPPTESAEADERAAHRGPARRASAEADPIHSKPPIVPIPPRRPHAASAGPRGKDTLEQARPTYLFKGRRYKGRRCVGGSLTKIMRESTLPLRPASQRKGGEERGEMEEQARRGTAGLLDVFFSKIFIGSSRWYLLTLKSKHITKFRQLKF